MSEKVPRYAKTYEFPTKPEEQSFGQFLYDSKTGQFCGRTGKSWLQLAFFYICFYTVLIALFAICVQGLLSTLNHQYPKWQQSESLIGTSPGVTFRPVTDHMDSNNQVTYKAENRTDVKQWINRLDEFLLPYINSQTLPTGGTNQMFCDFNTPPTTGKVCAFDVSKLSPCTAQEGYGYNNSAPCIFLKLNRIYGWEPEYYDNPDELPDNMPADLVDHIRSLPAAERKQVWFSCSGMDTNDHDTVGPISYIPGRGMPSFYYPYMNTEGYLSPLIAVHFARPQVHTVINIECRAWAKNINYNGGTRDRQGSVHVELHIQ